jgi:exonuclease III
MSILQETKLQDIHVDEASNFFNSLGYQGYWTCSKEKKGYSGIVRLH